MVGDSRGEALRHRDLPAGEGEECLAGERNRLGHGEAFADGWAVNDAHDHILSRKVDRYVLQWIMLAVLLTLAAQSPDLGKPVTLRTVAKPVGEVLRDVSAQAGFTFVASQVREWPVIVSVKDLPVGQLLERLAEVTDAEWRKEAKQWTLERGPARVQKAIEIELADRAARLQPVVDALPTELTEEDLTKAQAEVERVRSQMAASGGAASTTLSGPSPAVGLMNALIKRLPIKELAAAPLNSFVAYSSSPTRGQVRLVGLSDDLLRNYRTARERFAARVKVPVEVQMVASEARKPLPTGSKFMLVLSRPQATANINVGLYVYGPDHRLLDLARSTLTPAALKLDDAEAPIKDSIRFSREALSSLRAFRYQNSASLARLTVISGDTVPINGVDPWVSDENIALARRAIESEPTAFAISEWLLDLTDRIGDGLVACLPDHTFVALSERLTPTATHDVLWNLMPTLGLERSRVSGLLTVKSQFFARADRYRVDRKALRKLVAAGGPHGLPPFAAVVEYAGSAPQVIVSSNLDAHLLFLIFRRTRAGLGEASSVAGLRLLRLVLAREPQVSQLTLDEIQSRYAHAYDAVVRSQFASMAFSNRPVSGAELPMEQAANPYGEPLPDGNAIALEIKNRGLEWVLMVLGDGSTHLSGPGGLGAFLGLKAENMSGFTPVLQLRSFHPARVVEQRILIRTGPYSVGFFHQDVHANLDQKWTIADLPAAWRETFEQGREQGSAIRVGQGTGTPPP